MVTGPPAMSTREVVLELRVVGGPRDGLVVRRSRPAKPGFYFLDANGRLHREPYERSDFVELGAAEKDGNGTRLQAARFVGHTHTVCQACGVVHERPERRYGPEAVKHAGKRPCSLCGGELA
jgi:hypothetical protein